jgi:phosphoglycerate dehydrogenase-like enzyme
MRIVFHGTNAANFHPGFAPLLDGPHDIAVIPEFPETQADRAAFAAAEVLIGQSFTPAHPTPANLRLYHSVGAGVDAIDLAVLPAQATLCNVFEHEHAIAEYVMAALLHRAVNFARADAELRQGRWPYWGGMQDAAHPEIRGQTIGILGFGRIGREIAVRARAFGLTVHAANRSPIPPGQVNHAYGLDELPAFMGSADTIVAALPLTPDTAGLVGAAALAAMRPDAVLINVGRGPVVDEQALYDALKSRRIGGAVIDTWYQYPAAGKPTLPSRLAFHELDNIVMTPHMSGWSDGTVGRRRGIMAANVNHLARGEALVNVVRAGGEG